MDPTYLLFSSKMYIVYSLNLLVCFYVFVEAKLNVHSVHDEYPHLKHAGESIGLNVNFSGVNRVI